MGRAASATSRPNSRTASGASGAPGSSHVPASCIARAAKASATSARTMVGATEPRATRTLRPASSTARQSPATEITMALRVPILENDPGPRMTFHRAPRISSPGASAVFFTPTRNSFHGMARDPPPARTRTISAS